MKCDKKDLLLYAVTDRSWLNGETLYSQVEKALGGGATFVQLREKHLDHDAFLQEAKEIKELCAKYQVPFVLDDDVELALEVGADGVHVGQSDMEAGDVRAKLGEDKICLLYTSYPGVTCRASATSACVRFISWRNFFTREPRFSSKLPSF